MMRPGLGFQLLAPIFAAAACVALAGCDPCGNEVVREVASPDGKLKAVLFQRNCGATTGFSSQVSVLGPQDTVSSAGNAFVADSNHGAARTGLWGGPEVALAWTSPHDLQVTYAGGARTYKQKEKARGVNIIYQSENRL